LARPQTYPLRMFDLLLGRDVSIDSAIDELVGQ
jgi:hypothetical protein